MRKLASVQRILAIESIPDADKIVKAQINGWWVVTAIDNGFKVNDLVVYCEIDSWIPHELAPFLSKGKEPREFNGVKGERLRTIKLRGQLSQGMILPLNVGYDDNLVCGKDGYVYEAEEGRDYTEILGIQKWEAPVNAQLQGKVRGNFPSFIPKTDQERCQNLRKEIFEKHVDEMYEVTIKLDGSSMTVYKTDDYETPAYDETATIQVSKVGVCSRNLDLDLSQEGNSFVDTAKNSGLLAAIEKLGLNIAVQGELMGAGIQGNRENLSELTFFVYDIFDIDKQKYLNAKERYDIFGRLRGLGAEIQHVPVFNSYDQWFNLNNEGITDTNGLLQLAEGKSLNNKTREGLVFKSVDSDFTFKAIANSFLLQGND